MPKNTYTSGLVDYHTHTTLCKHASGEPHEYVEHAIAAGLSEFGIADHCPIPAGYDTRHRMDIAQMPEYRAAYESLAEKYSDKIKLRYGIEADYVPGKMDELAKFLRENKFDYVLGSIHFIGDFAFDDPECLAEWKRKGRPDMVWTRYSELMADLVETGLFDILSHFDLPKKFGFYPADMKSFLGRIGDVLDLAARRGMAIEINSSGLRKTVREIYPSPAILKIAREKGLPITLGSDAHSPDEVAANYREAVELALSAGYREITCYSARKISRTVPLPRR